MALELEFIVDTEGLQLDEVLPMSDLLELEILFEETLDFEMEMVVTVDSSVYTDSTLSGSGTVSNPLAINILGSPEFADTQITPLATEATYTPTVWSYLVGLFTTVPKSVKEHFVKAWTVIENLKSRVTLLEDNYILKYVVPVNTNYIDLTLDKNGNAINIAEGETFEIIIPIREWVNPLGTSRINLRFNGITSSIYRVGNTGLLPNMITQGTYYYNNDVRVKLTLAGGNLHGHTMAYQESPKGTFVAGTPQMYGCRTDGYSFSAINRIELLVANANEIPAGVVILLKKI